MPMSSIRVLGIDLAIKTWADNGSALVEFAASGWQSCRVGVVPWLNDAPGPVPPDEMAKVLDAFARGNGVAAICLDGPQGWREPGLTSAERPGCGRWAEYEVRAQGKMGEYGETFPRNQAPWMRYCIEVFSHLLARPGVVLVNDRDGVNLAASPNGYYLLEVFPTSIWRASGLAPLPGKRRTTPARLADGRRWLAARYSMPAGFIPDRGSHDDLQAVVAALPGVGLLGGPAVPEPNGKPAGTATTDGVAHRVEGLIWDARPALPGKLSEQPDPLVAPMPPADKKAPEAVTVGKGVDPSGHLSGGVLLPSGDSPLLADERDEAGDAAVERGVRLFHHLLAVQTQVGAVGIGYANFAVAVHGVDRYPDLMGREYRVWDTGRVIELADQITEAARLLGEEFTTTRNGTTIRVGMDTFIWPIVPPHQVAARGLAEHQRKYGYSPEEWETVFPAKLRRLLGIDEARLAAGGDESDRRV